MPYLSFITDEALEHEVATVMSIAVQALEKANAQFEKNVIDPFSVIFEMAGFGINEVVSWESNERMRQSQKTLSNAFGNFHQNILGHINGWENLGIGRSVDLKCSGRKIIAEVKNKYNTVTGGKLIDVYNHLYQLVMPIESNYKGYTAYYVEIIPKPKGRNSSQKYNVPFTPSDKQTQSTKAVNELIRKIDGQSFYELVTGVPNALEQLHQTLPAVISRISPYQFPPDELKLINRYFKKAFA